MSRIEQFIRDHRDEFDGEEPAPQVWKNLEKDLIPKPASNSGRIITLNFMKWAAAAAILVLAGLGVYHLISPSQPKGTEIVQQPATGNDDLLQKINPTYAKEVYHFTQLIELKQSELKQIEKDNPELYKSFLGDITKLDSSYNALKKELPTNPNREQLLEAMIENLKLQSDLLNQQLQIIQQIKQSKELSHGKTI